MKWILVLQSLFAVFAASAQDSAVIPLWKNGAPGFEARRNEPEIAKDWWVRNINNPSITIFRPAVANASHAAVIICPGGGHTNLVFNSEGVDAAKYLTSLGITAIVLKYRLFRTEGSPYKEANTREDIFRAIRLVKSMAASYQLDTANIGVMGFSAGGEVAGWLSYYFNEQHFAGKPDNIDAINARPAFQVLIYPGPLVVPQKVETNAPQTFMLAANDDACCSAPLIQLLQMHRQAGVPAELHIYAKGDHAFNMGKRATLTSIKNWSQRLTDWFHDSNILKD